MNEREDKILQKLEELESKINEHFYMAEEEKKIIQIEQVRMKIPEQIKTIAIPRNWIDYKLEYFNSAQFKYALKINDAYPGDRWLYLDAWLYGEILFSEEKVDLGTAKIEKVCNEDQEDITVNGKYLTFERIGKDSWELTKNVPEAYMYRLVLKDFEIHACWNDVEIVDMGNTIAYKGICIAPMKELRLYMILPTHESTRIRIRHNVPGDPDRAEQYIITWNNGDPTVVQPVENKEW